MQTLPGTEYENEDEFLGEVESLEAEFESEGFEDLADLESETDEIGFDTELHFFEGGGSEEEMFEDDGVEFALEDSIGEAVDLGDKDYQVIGSDTRRRISSTRKRPFRYICKITPPGCTGTLIAPNKVLTAAHCVYNRAKRSKYSNVRVIPGKNGPGTSKTAEPFGSARAVRVNFPAAYSAAASPMLAWPHDYAVITLDRMIGRSVGTWPRMASIPASQLTRLRLNTAGYPGDKGGQHMFWTYNKVISVRGSRIEYLLDTFGGQSGSPVWLRRKSQRTLVAVHTSADDLGNTGASPVIANRGVALTPAIIKQIQAWVRS